MENGRQRKSARAGDWEAITMNSAFLTQAEAAVVIILPLVFPWISGSKRRLKQRGDHFDQLC
jgi:hypothetical protein